MCRVDMNERFEVPMNAYDENRRTWGQIGGEPDGCGAADMSPEATEASEAQSAARQEAVRTDAGDAGQIALRQTVAVAAH